MEAIEIRSLTKRYKEVVAVDSLSLTIHSGELFSLLGVNGAGKTTTIKMLTGWTSPSSGDALLYGHSIKTDLESVKNIIALSPQETAIAPNLSVRENLDLMCGIRGYRKEEKKQKINRILEEVSLTSIEKKKASKLSGGQQRRLSIAMA